MLDAVIPAGTVLAKASVPIRAVTAAAWPPSAPWMSQSALAATKLAGFEGRNGDLALIPTLEGDLEGVVVGLGDGAAPAEVFRSLSARLPPGDYHLDPEGPPGVAGEATALAWALGSYRFGRFKREQPRAPARLVLPADLDAGRIQAIAGACALARDMVNTPANHMGPQEIEDIARQIAVEFAAEIRVTIGDELLAAGYPAVHAVGRAAAGTRLPRFIEISWTSPKADPSAPLIAVVGKGVTFDTGGLDIKPSAGMRLMKKDMGGAAHALALAKMVMASDLPVRMAVLIPAVENAISGDAMRPGDILASRSGLTIEVGNTDAEGRLILADALARAAELKPALTVDLATLTGAARVALGPQVIPFYTPDEQLASDLSEAATAADDPLWRMPLWSGYRSALESDVADIKNDPDGWAQAGSVTAALFLQRFAPAGAWAHFDIFAWNPRARPGWPAGGEAQAIRAIFAMLERRHA